MRQLYAYVANEPPPPPPWYIYISLDENVTETYIYIYNIVTFLWVEEHSCPTGEFFYGSSLTERSRVPGEFWEQQTVLEC